MSNPIRILVVEDEAVIRVDLQDRLESLGHQVVGMTDTAADGIRLAKNFKPDLVFMDIRLKGKMDGIAAAEQIHDQLRIPVIYLTAFADDDTLLRAKMTEPFGYLHKPCQDRDLKTAIEIGLHKHEVERKLRESELRYKTTVNSISEGIIAVDSQGIVTLLNPVAEQMTGWNSADARGQPLRKIFDIHEEDGEAMPDPVRETLRTGRPAPVADGTILRRKDGLEFPIDDLVAPILDDGKQKSSGAVVAFRDISERLRSEAQLRHVQKLESLGVMSSGIAHDFNNLLTPVMGFAGLLRMELVNNPRALQMVEQIENAAKRASDLTKQLLSYTGRATMTIRSVNLTRLVTEMMVLLNVSISRKSVMKLELEDPLPLTEGDEAQLQQVAMNLIMNASEALPGGTGTIRVKTGLKYLLSPDIAHAFGKSKMPAGEYVFLEVADDGVGMNAETLAKIFDPFFTTKFTGRGLGLSAVLGIVQGHRGVLFVDSEPGKGTTFRVCFPRSHRQPVAAAPLSVNLPPSAAHGQILIVDDERSIQHVLKNILERAGYQTLTADDGRQALERFGDRLGGIDAVMVDLLMPLLDGMETSRELRKRRPDLKIILMSGFAPEELSARLGDLIVSAILQKPFRGENVLSLLSAILKR
ncbi:ATP-binding response regulator [Zavarzinella formosa]|uniref:ATP-binding response regulator n=1 Tax=Zavarzinella formosa TaxID=360055 RepID=UPI0004951A6B|nr:response regulator [Zavarzinella formosa]